MSHLYLALAELQVLVGPVLARVEAGTITSSGPWRPPEWNGPALTALTVPATEGSEASVYVFDAVFRAEHTRELRRTEHPIQSSAGSALASITDHAILLPARVVLDIGMSDAMDSYLPGQWNDKVSKSVSAFQTLVALQAARTLLTLTTRLDTYPNMVIESILPCDTEKTRHGLRATVVLSQVFLADATAARSTISYGEPGAVSDRPQSTQATPSGVVQGQPTTNAVSDQFRVSTATATKFPRIPGAGAWSSVNPSRLGGILG